MASEPQPDSPKNSSQERDRLPFEPAKNRQKPAKHSVTQPKAEVSSTSKAVSRSERGIPEIVSKRMLRRVAWFSGVPTLFGFSTFFVSYFIVSQNLFKLPHVAVVLVSMGFFGLGVLGLSYGALSASWDEDRLGSWLGWGEFTTNWGRMTGAWQATAKKND